ncbi:hypothetical protein, partial [Escherichia coli]
VTYEAFWASNAIYVHGGTSLLADQLAARPDVEGLYEPVEYQLIEPDPTAAAQAVAERRAAAVEWGIANINADDVWDEFGTRGAGITIA